MMRQEDWLSNILASFSSFQQIFQILYFSCLNSTGLLASPATSLSQYLGEKVIFLNLVFLHLSPNQIWQVNSLDLIIGTSSRSARFRGNW